MGAGGQGFELDGLLDRNPQKASKKSQPDRALLSVCWVPARGAHARTLTLLMDPRRAWMIKRV